MTMKNTVTFLILRNAGTKVHQATFSQNMLKYAALCSAIMLLSIALILVKYFSLKHEVVNKHILEKTVERQLSELSGQREQIQVFADQINDLKAKLLELNNFEKKIRVIANIEESPDSEGIFGVGGSMPADLDVNIPLDDKHHALIREMHEQVDGLELASTRQQQEFEGILEKLKEKRNLLACTPSIMPAKGWISSSFGYRTSPFTGRREFHKGLDIASHKNDPIVATADGVISFAGRKGLLGNAIVIDHGHGVSTRYGHCYKLKKKRGDKVKRGDVIATIGSTGRSTGPHLHYEVRLNGVQVNPTKYIITLYAEKGHGKAPRS